LRGKRRRDKVLRQAVARARSVRVKDRSSGRNRRAFAIVPHPQSTPAKRSVTMSSIPNSAMPHATAAEPQEEQGGGATLTERAGKLAEQAGDYARENPKTAIAAGVALAAGAIAAAAIPLVRGRSGSGGAKKSGGARKTSSTKKS
jgi:hypothetical protein